MIKHIVMWKFREETPETDRREMKHRLESLQGKVPGLQYIEVGRDFSGKAAAMDMVLHTEFNSMDDLAAYAAHPEHLKVVEFIKPRVCERAVVDYEI